MTNVEELTQISFFMSMTYRCTALKQKIQTITDGEYSTAKREVDALRAELGQPPVPSLQQTLEEKSSAYVFCPDAPLLFSLFTHFNHWLAISKQLS